MKNEKMEKSAVFSVNRLHRYSLARTWNKSGPKVLFICLNPSTADSQIDDPTVRKCIGFAKTWGFGGMCIGNLFSFRATDPKELKHCKEPIGATNDYWLGRLQNSCDEWIAAWGANAAATDERVMHILSMFSDLRCLGFTKSGAPRHPLYMPYRSVRRRFPNA